jgi:hypothetical protein
LFRFRLLVYTLPNNVVRPPRLALDRQHDAAN